MAAETPIPSELQVSPRKDIEQRLAWNARGIRDYRAAHEVFEMIEDPHYKVRNGLDLVEGARTESFPIDISALNLRHTYSQIDAHRYSLSAGISLQGAMISALEGDFGDATRVIQQHNRENAKSGMHQFEAADAELFVISEMLLAGHNPSPVVKEYGKTFKIDGYAFSVQRLADLYRRFGLDATDLVRSFKKEIDGKINGGSWQTASYAQLYLKNGLEDEAIPLVDSIVSGANGDKGVGSWNDKHDLVVALAQEGHIDKARQLLQAKGTDAATDTRLGAVVVRNPQLVGHGTYDEKFFLDAIRKRQNGGHFAIGIFTDAISGLHALGVSKDKLRGLASRFLSNATPADEDTFSYERLARELVGLGLPNHGKTALQLAYDSAMEYYHPYPHVESFAKPDYFSSVARTATALDQPELADKVSDVLTSLARNKPTDLDEMEMAELREEGGKPFALKDLAVDDIVREQISKGLIAMGIDGIKKGMTWSEFNTLNRRTVDAISRGSNSYASSGVNHFLGTAS